MPKYLNSTSDIIFPGDPYIRLAPGETVTDKYIKDLPEGVALTDHDPIISPWVAVASDADDLYQVAPYDNIAIYNASDEVATVSANTDDSNAYSIMSGAKEVFSNDQRIFGCIRVLTKGSGTVYIYGVR